MKAASSRVACVGSCLLCVISSGVHTSQAAELPAPRERESIPGTEVLYSDAPPCAKLDFERELAAYRAVYATAVALPGADTARVVVVGMSNGGGLRAIVPDLHAPFGYVVSGGWLKTWYEWRAGYLGSMHLVPRATAKFRGCTPE